MATEKVTYELSLRDLMSKGLSDINNKMAIMEGRLSGVQKSATKSGTSFMDTFGGMKSALAGSAIVGALGFVAKSIFDVTAEAEQSRIAMGVMLGSTAKADQMISNLRGFAAVTPFETSQLESAAKLMLNYGIAAEDIMPNIKMLGDVSGGNGEKMERLTLAFSQIQAQGKLTGQDLLQLVNAGFNPLKTISDKTGVSLGELKEQMSDGAISAKMVSDAFKVETQSGGRFFGMMEKQSHSLTGKLSTLKDNIVLMGIGIGENALPQMNGFLDVMLGLTNAVGSTSFEALSEAFAEVGSVISNLFEPIFKVLEPLGMLVSFIPFLKLFASTITIMVSPLALLADAVSSLYEAMASLFTLDWERFTKIDPTKNINSIGTTLKDIWSDDKKGPGQKMLNKMESKVEEKIKFDIPKADKDKDKLKGQSASVEGSVPKVVNINIEALIKDVTNNFGSSAINVQNDARSFLDQLQNSLQMIITDTALITQSR